MSLKSTPHQIRNQRVNAPKGRKKQKPGPPTKISPWSPIGGGPPKKQRSTPNKVPTVHSLDTNLTKEQMRELSESEKSFLKKQEARYTRPRIHKENEIKIKIPEKGLSAGQVARYYRIFGEPAGMWRVNVVRTLDGIKFAMVGPRDLDPDAEVEKILHLMQMAAFGKNAITYTKRPIMKGDVKMFEVDIEAKPIHVKTSRV